MRIAIVEQKIEHYPTITLKSLESLDKQKIICYNLIIKQIKKKEIKK